MIDNSRLRYDGEPGLLAAELAPYTQVEVSTVEDVPLDVVLDSYYQNKDRDGSSENKLRSPDRDGRR
jgi:hypothetical protein